jgi:hypothetical protein
LDMNEKGDGLGVVNGRGMGRGWSGCGQWKGMGKGKVAEGGALTHTTSMHIACYTYEGSILKPTKCCLK